jgi:hypothetical protein
MNKQTQFKVALKRYLNTYSFYYVEFLTYKRTHNTCKSFFPPTVLLYGLRIIFVYFMSNFFCVLCLQYFEKVFVCGFVVLCLCYFYFVLSAFICMLCIFVTYSTYHCCHYKLKEPWNICMYVCMYVSSLQ